VERCGLDASDSGSGSVADSYEHGKEPAGSIKGGEFLDRVIISFSRALLHGVS
jgi:hypothetical protein